MDFFSRLEEIEQKVRHLKNRCEQLEQENLELKSEHISLKNQLESKNQEILNLVETNKISKLAQSAIDPDEKSELKHNIEQIIKEIDNCIRLVKQ